MHVAIANAASRMNTASVSSITAAMSVAIVAVGPIVGIAAAGISVIGRAVVPVIGFARQREGKRSQAKGSARDRRARVPTIVPMIVSVMIPIVPIMMPITISCRLGLCLLWCDKLRTR